MSLRRCTSIFLPFSLLGKPKFSKLPLLNVLPPCSPKIVESNFFLLWYRSFVALCLLLCINPELRRCASIRARVKRLCHMTNNFLSYYRIAVYDSFHLYQLSILKINEKIILLLSNQLRWVIFMQRWVNFIFTFCLLKLYRFQSKFTSNKKLFLLHDLKRNRLISINLNYL